MTSREVAKCLGMPANHIFHAVIQCVSVHSGSRLQSNISASSLIFNKDSQFSTQITKTPCSSQEECRFLFRETPFTSCSNWICLSHLKPSGPCIITSIFLRTGWQNWGKDEWSNKVVLKENLLQSPRHWHQGWAHIFQHSDVRHRAKTSCNGYRTCFWSSQGPGLEPSCGETWRWQFRLFPKKRRQTAAKNKTVMKTHFVITCRVQI